MVIEISWVTNKQDIEVKSPGMVTKTDKKTNSINPITKEFLKWVDLVGDYHSGGLVAQPPDADLMPSK